MDNMAVKLVRDRMADRVLLNVSANSIIPLVWLFVMGFMPEVVRCA